MGLDISFRKVKRTDLSYFRKVNFLVKFFNDKYPELKNCYPIDITKEDLFDLKNRCEEVLHDHTKADKLLPTQDGFFFGSVDYDDDYYKDVQDVLNAVADMLSIDLANNENIEFEIWY